MEIVQDYYANSRSSVATVRALHAKHNCHNAPSERAIQRIIAKFENDYNLYKNVPSSRQRKAHSEGNIAAVQASVEANPNQAV